jgi:hypothetical protein
MMAVYTDYVTISFDNHGNAEIRYSNNEGYNELARVNVHPDDELLRGALLALDYIVGGTRGVDMIETALDNRQARRERLQATLEATQAELDKLDAEQ